MTVVASLALSEGQFVLGRALAGTDARIELVDLVPVEEALVPYFWVTDTHDPDSFDERVRDSESTTEITRLDESADRTLYRLRWEETREDLFDALADNDILVEEGVRTDGEGSFNCVPPTTTRSRAFATTVGSMISPSTCGTSTTILRRTTIPTGLPKSNARRSNWPSNAATSRCPARRRSPNSPPRPTSASRLFRVGSSAPSARSSPGFSRLTTDSSTTDRSTTDRSFETVPNTEFYRQNQSTAARSTERDSERVQSWSLS